MSYHKNDIEISELNYDAREDDGYDATYKFADKKVIQLPHSCDSWVIGQKEEAEQMIEDLKKAIALLQSPTQEEVKE